MKSSPLRVLFFRPPFRGNYLYFRYEQYAELLKRRGAAIRIIAPPPKGESGDPQNGALSDSPSTIAARLDLADLVILSPSPNMFAILTVLKLLRKNVILEHYLSYVSHRELSSGFPIALDRYSYRLVDHIITHTAEMKTDISATLHVPLEKITAFYCAVDLRVFSPSAVADPELAARIGKRTAVFYHGMAHPGMGLDVLLQASELLKEESDFVFIILVPGIEVPRRSNIIYIDEEKPFRELPRYLAAGHIWCSGFAHDARGDRAFSSTLIQALAMGIPVTTSPSREKNRYLVDNQNALMIPPNDPESLAEGLLQHRKKPEHLRQIGIAGRKLAETHFNLQKEDRLGPLFDRFLNHTQ